MKLYGCDDMRILFIIHKNLLFPFDTKITPLENHKVKIQVIILLDLNFLEHHAHFCENKGIKVLDLKSYNICPIINISIYQCITVCRYLKLNTHNSSFFFVLSNG